jgi:PTS system nitrogen regulatory IIA component
MNEVAEHLHLSMQEMEMLVKRGDIPCERQGDRVFFVKRQVDAWASQRILGMSDRRLEDYHQATSARHHNLSPRHALLPELMGAERIAPGIVSRTRPSLLRDMVNLAERTELVCDPVDLLRSLEERESLCSTALPNGVALLHPRHHEPYMFTDSFIVLGRAANPIHFSAPDGNPTDLFFLVCCQDDRIHLHTLARLCTMIRSTEVMVTLRAAEAAADMMAALTAAEAEVIRRL